MQYQELELGIAKKLTENTKRHFNYQHLVNGCLLVWMLCCSVGFVVNYSQVQYLHWHLNATHARVRELEAWQRHMCTVRHYNCPEGMDLPEYVDEWDWDNFPSMDDYNFEEEEVDPEFKDLPRMKREIIAETTDGVPIYTQSFAETKQTNATRRKMALRRNKTMATTDATDDVSVPVMQAGFHSPAWPATKQAPELKLYKELEGKKMTVTSKPIMTRSSRVMFTPDKPSDEEESVPSAQTIPRAKSLATRSYQGHQSDELNSYPNPRSYRRRASAHARQRVAESFEEEVAPAAPTIVRPMRRHMPAAHYHGDTSKYSLGIHQNYHGNGHLKHPDRTYVDWISSDWMEETNRDGIFNLNNGVLTVNEDGLYFVYSQIFYVDDHDLNGYHVYRNQEMILQCTTMTHSTTRVRKSNTCYTAGVERLASGDKIYVRDLSNERFSLFEKGKSFFGVLKLSDMRVK